MSTKGQALIESLFVVVFVTITAQLVIKLGVKIISTSFNNEQRELVTLCKINRRTECRQNEAPSASE